MANPKAWGMESWEAPNNQIKVNITHEYGAKTKFEFEWRRSWDYKDMCLISYLYWNSKKTCVLSFPILIVTLEI